MTRSKKSRILVSLDEKNFFWVIVEDRNIINMNATREDLIKTSTNQHSYNSTNICNVCREENNITDNSILYPKNATREKDKNGNETGRWLCNKCKAKNRCEMPESTNNIHKKNEKCTLEWIVEQKKKQFDKKNKIIERWERCNISNIFKDKGFNDEDREDWYHFWNSVDIKENIKECWPWTKGCVLSGYGQFWFIHRNINILAHRIAYMLSKGAMPDRFQVQHICNNPICCNPNHLELGSPAKNSEYMVKCNRQGQQKLTEEQVKIIHTLYIENSKSIQEIAKMFKISVPNIYNIISGRIWHSVYKEFEE